MNDRKDANGVSNDAVIDRIRKTSQQSKPDIPNQSAGQSRVGQDRLECLFETLSNTVAKPWALFFIPRMRLCDLAFDSAPKDQARFHDCAFSDDLISSHVNTSSGLASSSA